MARLHAAVLALGAVLLAPSALALLPEASSPLSAPPLSPPTLPALLPDTPEAAAQAVQDAQAAARTATCRDAVQVTLVGYGGRTLVQAPGSAAFLMPWTATETVTEQVPVYRTTTEAVGGVLGLFPQTRQVTRLLGYEESTRTVSETLDLAVAADWVSDYVTWTEVRQTVLVTLPVGLPLVAAGEGVLTKVCDDSVPIVSVEPSMDTAGFDHWSTLPVSDGWFLRILSLDVHLATATEQATLPTDQGALLCPTDVLRLAEAHAERLGLKPGDGAARGLPPLGGAGEAAGPAAAGAGPAGAGLAAPAGALAAVAAVGLALAGWRRLR